MERREKKGSAETLRGEQEEEKKDILSGSLGPETQGLQAFNNEDDEEEGSTALISACQKGMTEAGACFNV